ncbi:sterile alpha motif domain-containing 3-like isoform X2 [Labeo rohita]|uniref:Sterile alpha motif domain-containing 3-like isoform X2 n=1 Tax=Labeo rohita TaxID=84645 RepID=A0A498MLD8_LABRO|nr:sterile alpha motif domain-containing 3-like isoform X2 [Labeo rohita]
MVFVKEESEEDTSEPEPWKIKQEEQGGLMKVKEERQDLNEVEEKYQSQKDHDVNGEKTDSADDHVFQDLDLGILLVEREGAVSPSSLHLNPASFKTVIEGEVVMKSIKDLPKAMCLLFGLTYALHLSYPKPMKNTFQFIQQEWLFTVLDVHN